MGSNSAARSEKKPERRKAKRGGPGEDKRPRLAKERDPRQGHRVVVVFEARRVGQPRDRFQEAIGEI